MSLVSAGKQLEILTNYLPFSQKLPDKSVHCVGALRLVTNLLKFNNWTLNTIFSYEIVCYVSVMKLSCSVGYWQSYSHLKLVLKLKSETANIVLQLLLIFARLTYITWTYLTCWPMSSFVHHYRKCSKTIENETISASNFAIITYIDFNHS